MTTRLPDWQLRLETCLAERFSRPFAFGAQDCALFAADCVEASTGRDPAAGIRGRYRDARGASRIVRRLGGLEAIARDMLGSEVSTALAQPGDVGLLENAGRPCLGVCTGLHWLAPGALGLLTLPREQARLAWRVGRGI